MIAKVGNSLQWDQAAPDLATAQSYTYQYYPDGSATGVALSGVVVTGASSPFVCTVPFPAFTPGDHTLTVSATDAGGESVQSAPLAFTFAVVPATPVNLRVV